MDDNSDGRRLVIFGKDFAKDPCFKSTFTNAILAALLSGFGTFLLKNNVRKATFYSYNGFFITAIASELWCRYQWHQKTKKIQMLENEMHRDIIDELPDAPIEPDAK